MSKTKSMLKIIPYKDIDYTNQVLIDRHDCYQSFLKVRTTDLETMNIQNLSSWMEQLSMMCRLYIPSFKIMSLTYSTETMEQQLFWQKKYQQNLQKLQNSTTEKEKEVLSMQNNLIKENMNRVVWVEQNLNELAFFIIVYGKEINEVLKNRTDMIRYGGTHFHLRILSGEELEKISFRLQNMMSKY